jgi:hypothetical protein
MSKEKKHVRPTTSSIRDENGKLLMTRVYDAQRRKYMGAKGYPVPMDRYWRRLLRFRSIELVSSKPSAPPEDKPKSTPRRRRTSEGEG